MGIIRWFAGLFSPRVTRPERPAASAPAAKVEKKYAKERRDGPRTNAREGTRVLIIDDSPTIVALLRKLLRQNGFVTLEAGDAEQGIAIAQAEVPDLIFLDIVLPGMNGFAALRQLRRAAPTKTIPIIMISGNEQATEQFYAQRIGADDFMKKPFSRAEVFTRIERLLDVDLVPKRPGG
ncbi:MAG: response regulator [Tahibacter sp.]